MWESIKNQLKNLRGESATEFQPLDLECVVYLGEQEQSRFFVQEDGLVQQVFKMGSSEVVLTVQNHGMVFLQLMEQRTHVILDQVVSLDPTSAKEVSSPEHGLVVKCTPYRY